MVQIRRPNAGDEQSVVNILNETIRTGREVAITEETSIAGQRQWFEAHQQTAYPLWVAEIAGQVVGWISLSPYRPGRNALRHTVEVSYGVAASFRRQGIGTAMLAYVLLKAKEIGHRIVFAVVFDNNVPTHRLLKKCGFEQWGHLPDVAHLNNEWVGHDYLGLRLYPEDKAP